MKRIVLVAAAGAAALAAGSAPAATGLWPHVYGATIRGSAIPQLNGSWRLAIQRYSFSLTKGSTVAVSGSVRISRNRITFRDIAGPLACRGTQVSGTYTWRVVRARLTLTRVVDACVGRRSVLSRVFRRIA